MISRLITTFIYPVNSIKWVKYENNNFKFCFDFDDALW